MKYHEEEIYGAIARGWCDERNSGKEMDIDLADAIAVEVLAVVRPLRARVAELEAEREAFRIRAEKLGKVAEAARSHDCPGWDLLPGERCNICEALAALEAGE